jgi:hypothetical protein
MKRLFLLSLAACGGGGEPSNTPDVSTVPAMVVVSGEAEELGISGGTPVEGLLVEAFTNANDTTPITTAMTDAEGKYSISIPTNGVPLDGFIKATKAGLVDTYLYPPGVLEEDFAGASLKMVSANTFALLSGALCDAAQVDTNGTIAMLVTDAEEKAVAGATVSSTPASNKYCYNGDNGLPSRNATETFTDGVGYMFNVTGRTTVSATKDGLTFPSHVVTARAGALTTTVIRP